MYQVKAELFKVLGHPLRIRVLELLSERERGVSELAPLVGAEPAQLSPQLAVLRKAGLVNCRKEGTVAVWSLRGPQVAELLVLVRATLSQLLSEQAELLADLRAAPHVGRAETGGKPIVGEGPW
jgi:DNA-binding transcriptional ArsR family regulator